MTLTERINEAKEAKLSGDNAKLMRLLASCPEEDKKEFAASVLSLATVEGDSNGSN